MKKINQQKFIELSKAFKSEGVTQAEIDRAKENNQTIPCYYGVWNPNTEEFHEWGVTPSSEDRGYSTY